SGFSSSFRSPSSLFGRACRAFYRQSRSTGHTTECSTSVARDRRTDFEEQTVRFAKLALAGGFVAENACQLGALHVDPRRVGACSGRIDQCVGVAQVGLDQRSHWCAIDREEGARVCEERDDLEETHAPLSREGDRGLSNLARLVGMPGAEMCAGERREMARLEEHAGAASVRDDQGGFGRLCRRGPLTY